MGNNSRRKSEMSGSTGRLVAAVSISKGNTGPMRSIGKSGKIIASR
jgi:hypothetical protein